MSLRQFAVVLRGAGGERTVVVPSKTEVQAGDAATALATEGESIVSVTELDPRDDHANDGPPPGTQTRPDQVT